ncbi:MAG: hypothetical protein IPM57_08525 [Oligoflexia bacterium]|nr:hypothetical protein [Oligoflexia bacterium]
MEAIKEIYTPTTQDYAENLQTCCLCGGKLSFKHEVDFYTLTVKEECGCPTCGIKNNPLVYSLQ